MQKINLNINGHIAVTKRCVNRRKDRRTVRREKTEEPKIPDDIQYLQTVIFGARPTNTKTWETKTHFYSFQLVLVELSDGIFVYVYHYSIHCLVSFSKGLIIVWCPWIMNHIVLDARLTWKILFLKLYDNFFKTCMIFTFQYLGS